MPNLRRSLGGAAALLIVITLYLLMNARTFQLFGPLVARVPTSEPLIALTFDDGPSQNFTPTILALLADLDVPATFFVTGADLAAHPDLGRQIVAAGHALGNHSYSHQRMIFVTPGFVQAEIEQTDRLIRATGYADEIFFRPPYGKKLVVLPAYLARTDRTTIMWDIEPESNPSIAQDRDRITANVVEQARPGSIILLHVMHQENQPSREAVRDIVLQLRAQGYHFVTIPDLLAARQAK